MTLQEIVKLIEGTIVVAAIAAVFFASFKHKSTQTIIEQQKELIDVLTTRVDTALSENKELRHLHLQNEKAISKLEGQVEVYKELPLTKIATAMEQITETQGKILKELEKANA